MRNHDVASRLCSPACQTYMKHGKPVEVLQLIGPSVVPVEERILLRHLATPKAYVPIVAHEFNRSSQDAASESVIPAVQNLRWCNTSHVFFCKNKLMHQLYKIIALIFSWPVLELL